MNAIGEAEFLSFPSPSDFGEFRVVLEGAGYTEPEILQVLKVAGFQSLKAVPVELLLARSDDPEPLHVLIRLFLLQVPVEEKSFREAVRPFPVEKCIHAGLIETANGLVIPKVALRPLNGMIFAHDCTGKTNSPGGEDFVMGVGDSSRLLINGTVRRQSVSTLDLGTGCGIQGLVAASHSRNVTAVDVNRRAVLFTRFNSVLNGVTNLAALEGSFFEPLGRRTFDLIVSNPPFVISPDKRFIFRDGGMETDRVCERIVREASSFMNKGGFCQILCNWVEKAGEGWRERIAGWLEDTECDALVLRMERHDPDSYAAMWLGHTEKGEPDKTLKLQQWIRYYREHCIESIGAGLITMRRSNDRSTWFRALDIPEIQIGREYGSFILRQFGVIDFLQGLRDDRALFDMPLRVNPELSLWHKQGCSEKGWKAAVCFLSLQQCIPVSVETSVFMTEILAGCDGRRSVREVYSTAALRIGIEPTIPAAFGGELRRMIELGFLFPLHISH